MTKYDLFRRRIAPVAFGLAIVLIARDSCDKQDRTSATFVLDFGTAEPTVKAVDAELWIDHAQISHFHRAALGGRIGPAKFAGLVPGTDGEIRVDVDLANGEHRHVVRHVHVDEGAVVTVPLERDLR